MTGPRLQITELSSRGGLSVARAEGPGSGGVPILVFASAGKNARRAARREFIGALSGLNRPILFLRDEGQVWYATARHVETIRHVAEDEMSRAGVDKVDTIGTSMGGFAALAIGAVVPVRNALSFVPRFSPDPEILPDPRLRSHLMTVRTAFNLPTALPGYAAADDALILHGMFGPDLRHVRAFRDADPRDHWVFLEPSHFIAQILRDAGRLTPLVHAALSGRRREARDILRASGALRAERVGQILEPMIAGHEAMERDGRRNPDRRFGSVGQATRAALGRVFGAREIPSSASDIPGVAEDPRFEGLTCKQVAIQVTA